MSAAPFQDVLQAVKEEVREALEELIPLMVELMKEEIQKTEVEFPRRHECQPGQFAQLMDQLEDPRLNPMKAWTIRWR
jgi:hypothetical protein